MNNLYDDPQKLAGGVAYLDAVGAKARKERLRATHEDGGDADDLHLSADGTSKLRNAKRIKALCSSSRN
jgi:hypothetical protein